MAAGDIDKLKKDIVFEETIRGHTLTFHSTWGLFSPKEVDAGSRLLIENVDIDEDSTTLDIGCGYGAIGLFAAKMAPRGVVHMVDKDFVAVNYAKVNAQKNNLNNAKVYLSNGFSHVPEIQFDQIVSNIPAKAGKEFFWIILNDAKKHLKKGGKIYFVSIKGLKGFLKRNFKETFGNYKKVKHTSSHYLIMAEKK